jgi:dolichyl-phosphate beta-glucosyltransferase
MPRVSLVVPCYNEVKRLKAERFLQLIASGPDVTLVFVNDGSTDETGTILGNLASSGSRRISVLTLAANSGKAEAVRLGMLAAFETQPHFAGYWDADLSAPLTEVQAFIDLLALHPDVDIAIGARVKMLGHHIERSAVRHYLGRLFATAASLALRIPVYDTQCGAKLFRANDAIRSVFATPFRSPWAMDVEILSRYIAQLGRETAVSRMREVPLQVWTAVPGTKLRPLPALRALGALWRIRRRSRGAEPAGDSAAP